MDIQTELVLNPALQHIEWCLYAIHVRVEWCLYAIHVRESSTCSTSNEYQKIGLKTCHKGIWISVEFHEPIGKYDISIDHNTIAVLPKLDAISRIEQLIHRIDSATHLKILLSKLFGSSNVLGYGSLLDRRQATSDSS
jgi:hypothetical protein